MFIEHLLHACPRLLKRPRLLRIVDQEKYADGETKVFTENEVRRKRARTRWYILWTLHNNPMVSVI